VQLKGRSFFRLSPSGLAGGYFALWVAERTAQLAEAFHEVESQKRLLEMVATGRALPELLDALCRFVEETASGCRCSVLLLDPGSKRLRHGAAPGLPPAFTRAIDGSPAHPDGGPCGMAVSQKEQVIAADLESDSRWDASGWRAFALAHGLRACWSTAT